MDINAARRVYLEPGDPVADMGWRDHRGDQISLYHSSFAGRLTVLFVCPSAKTPGAARELTRYPSFANSLSETACAPSR